MKLLLLLALLLLPQESHGAIASNPATNLTDTQKIGLLIWKNEAAQKRELLVFWNTLESFPSLGIGHCIWYLEGQKKGPYTEQFPLLCAYLKKHGTLLPAWLDKAIKTGAPWKTRTEFLQDTQRTEELRALLCSTIDLQTQYMIERCQERLILIMQAVPEDDKMRVAHTLELMKSSPLGTYALVDYLNFKGDGLNEAENRKGDRWGLLQVLLGMPSAVDKDVVVKLFTISAAEKLLRLVKNSEPEYKSIKFLSGWMSRVSSYSNENVIASLDASPFALGKSIKEVIGLRSSSC